MGSHVAFFVPYFQHVGTVPFAQVLSERFRSAGHDIDLLRTYEEWSPDHFPQDDVVALNGRFSRWVMDRERLPFRVRKMLFGGFTLPHLVTYIRQREPDVLFTALLGAVGIAATRLAGCETKVVSVIHGYPHESRLRSLFWPEVYGRADEVVAPIHGVAKQTSTLTGIAEEEIRVLPDPVVTEELLQQSEMCPDHEWFDDDVPVLLAVGRQTPQKGFEVLLKALATVRDQREVRLVVLGREGESTPLLRRTIDELGLDDVVDFPGFVENPYSYMRAADLFVLSSRWEGGAHVLIEAMAVGEPIIATDCPTGTRELLEDGDAGSIVPVDDAEAMAYEILALLDDEDRRHSYGKKAQRAIEPFHVERAAEGYLDLIEEISGEN